MANAFGDLQVAVWAHPRLVIIGIRTNAGLSCVFDPALNLSPANTHPHRREV